MAVPLTASLSGFASFPLTQGAPTARGLGDLLAVRGADHD